MFLFWFRYGRKWNVQSIKDHKLGHQSASPNQPCYLRWVLPKINQGSMVPPSSYLRWVSTREYHVESWIIWSCLLIHEHRTAIQLSFQELKRRRRWYLRGAIEIRDLPSTRFLTVYPRPQGINCALYISEIFRPYVRKHLELCFRLRIMHIWASSSSATQTSAGSSISRQISYVLAACLILTEIRTLINNWFI